MDGSGNCDWDTCVWNTRVLVPRPYVFDPFAPCPSLFGGEDLPPLFDIQNSIIGRPIFPLPLPLEYYECRAELLRRRQEENNAPPPVKPVKKTESICVKTLTDETIIIDLTGTDDEILVVPETPPPPCTRRIHTRQSFLDTFRSVAKPGIHAKRKTTRIKIVFSVTKPN